MSGGAVLDSQGRLVGIHTSAENEIYLDEQGNYEQYSLGFSLGVGIQELFGLIQSGKTELQTSWLEVVTEQPPELSQTDIKGIKAQLQTVEEPQNKGISDWMNYGNQQWRYGNFAKTVQAFEQVLALAPDSHQAYYALGLTYRSQGGEQYRQGEIKAAQKSYQQAVTAFEKATEINPSPYYYWRWLGFAYTELEQYDRAIVAYDRAIEKNSQDFVLYKERGDVFNGSKQHQEAIADYTQAAQIKPNHPWIYNNRGNAYADLQQYDKAIADFNHSLSINPLFDQPYNNRGNIYHELQQYERAISDFTQAINLNPQNFKAYYNRATSYSYLEKYDLAIANYTKAISINSELAQAYYNRGIVYADLQQYEKAIADFTQVIKLDPDDADAYLGRANAYIFLNNLCEAKKDLESAVKLYQAQNSTERYQQASGFLKQFEEIEKKQSVKC